MKNRKINAVMRQNKAHPKSFNIWGAFCCAGFVIRGEEILCDIIAKGYILDFTKPDILNKSVSVCEYCAVYKQRHLY